MTGYDLWCRLYPQVAEVFRLMVAEAMVEAKHPRYAATVGRVTAVTVRPGKENVFAFEISAEVKEEGRNSVQIILPEYIRKVGRDGDQDGSSVRHVAGMQGTGEADRDHSGLLCDSNLAGAGDSEGGRAAAFGGDGAELQETAS